MYLEVPIPHRTLHGQFKMFRHIFSCTALILTTTLICGCGQDDSNSDEIAEADEQLLNELLGNGDVTTSTGDEANSNLPDPAEPIVPVAQSGKGTRLELNLLVGDRFPLIKTIEQTLIQRSETYPATALTKLQLTMAISVTDTRDDAVLLHVGYSRVQYSHDINGQKVTFDSDNHQGSIPDEVLPYAGMSGNGFSFWLGRDNKIRELVDYNQFLQRCVQHVPIARRESMLAEISTRFGDDGVANFVDDTIGLLPYNSDVDASSATRVLPGDTWRRERRLMQPIPVYMTSIYRLVDLTDKTAEIDITGRIASGETFVDSSDTTGASVRILGGQSIGSCVVDRATGLPLELKRTRFLNMKVRTEDGTVVDQDKQVLTVIRAFPEARGPVVRNPLPGPSGIQQVGGIQTNQTVVPIPVQPLNDGGAVRANY